MNNILDEICQNKLEELKLKKAETPLNEILQKVNKITENSGFVKSLEGKIKQGIPAIIAEVKKKSPSKGIIREDFDPNQIAREYCDNGAACISVLTDEKYFAGSDKYLKQIKKQNNIPLLRKDFILDEYQIYESKLLGADCVLLILSALELEQAKQLEETAIGLGMDVLIEVHDRDELQKALTMKSKLIGINNRNLKNMKVDINNSANMVKEIPDNYIKICESGIATANDIENMLKAGFNSFLIGETFMRQDNIGAIVKEFASVKI